MRLSVVIPVFNELSSLEELLKKVDEVKIEKEVIIVDDCSTDGTRALLQRLGAVNRVIILHDRNQGKGAALRSGFSRVTGDYVLIQDADLEYKPSEYRQLLLEAEKNGADVVYGSRFMRNRPKMAYQNWLGNMLLTALTNLLFGSHLTDMETCYKLIRRSVIKDLTIESDRFNVEPELTAKLLSKGINIFEIPISYSARSRSQGKKISWIDFVSAVWTLCRLRVVLR